MPCNRRDALRLGVGGALTALFGSLILWPRSVWAQSHSVSEFSADPLIHCHHLNPRYLHEVSIAGCMDCLLVHERATDSWVKASRSGRGVVAQLIRNVTDGHKGDGTIWALTDLAGVQAWCLPADPIPFHDRVVLPEHRGYAFGVRAEGLAIDQEGKFVTISDDNTYYHEVGRLLQANGITALSCRSFSAV